MLARLIFIVVVLFWYNPLSAQDLEPRRWNHVPVGVNFVGVGAAHTQGDIFLDPVLRIEDLEFRFSLGLVSLVHAFELFGQSARVDMSLPVGSGHWEGLVDGEPRTLDLRGMMDPSLRLSVNLYGAPALKRKEFAQYRANHPVNTVVGAAIKVTAPLGQYNPERLLNLGANRWTLRPQLGVLHQRGKMSYELTGSAILFSANNDFFGGTRLSRDTLYYLQGHIVRTFRPGMWLGFSVGYAIDGSSTIDVVPKNDGHRDFWAGITLGIPISPVQGIKIALSRAKTNTNTGSTSNSIVVGWSLMWGN